MVIQFTENMINESTKPIVLKAFATWCPHCAIMKPFVEELETELGQTYTFAEFDVDKYPELTQHFNVTQLPTFIFIKNRAEVARTTGEMSKSELKDNIENHLGS